jgi:FeS assembly SUF system regulator
MLRITKLTDYAIVVLAHLVNGHSSGGVSTARDLSKRSGLPGPTVGKILKELARGDVVVSQRGLTGGYRLAREPESISIADIVRAVEGPIALTDCNRSDSDACGYHGACPVEDNWLRINHAIFNALAAISLAEMAKPLSPKLIRLSAKRSSGQSPQSIPS